MPYTTLLAILLQFINYPGPGATIHKDRQNDTQDIFSFTLEYETTVDEGILNGRYGTARLRMGIGKLKDTRRGTGKGTCLPCNDEENDTYTSTLLNINRHKEGGKMF